MTDTLRFLCHPQENIVILRAVVFASEASGALKKPGIKNRKMADIVVAS